MSNKARMSDVFNLPINQNESEFFRNVINMPNCTKAIGQMNSESWARYTVKAINDYDILIEEIKAKDARIAELEQINLSMMNDLSLLRLGIECNMFSKQENSDLVTMAKAITHDIGIIVDRGNLK